jgi:SAM-dependent methyltransferase
MDLRSAIARIPLAGPWLGLRRDLRIRSLFDRVYKEHRWRSADSKSGPGSSVEQTAVIRDRLPKLVAELGIKSVLDIPCGDLHWMQHVDLGSAHYIGADIVEGMIAANRLRYAPATREFRVLDITNDALPQVDLIFCRDCLVHLSNRLIHKALARIVESRSTYLLTTTFPARSKNYNIPTGKWRPLNLCAAPFGLPHPTLVIQEGDSDATYGDKSLGLWKIADLAERL